MHREFLSVQRSTIELLREAARYGRIFAVGTSTVRTLETLKPRGGNGADHELADDIETGAHSGLSLSNGTVEGYTDLFIHPGYQFEAVDGMVTNFHMPRTTVLALVMAAALGPALDNTIVAISIPLIPYTARVIRSNTLALREQPFVEAARAVGMSEFRIAVRHVLPNTVAPLIVIATAQLGAAILTEASLSFLALGVPEPHPSWGRMLSESAAEYMRVAPWLVIFPGIAISLAVFGTNLFGDALRDILDPRLRD